MRGEKRELVRYSLMIQLSSIFRVHRILLKEPFLGGPTYAWLVRLPRTGGT